MSIHSGRFWLHFCHAGLSHAFPCLNRQSLKGYSFLARLFFFFSNLPLAELSTIVREHLEQFADAHDESGRIMCNVLLFPYVMNGAARGYRLSVPQKDWESLKPLAVLAVLAVLSLHDMEVLGYIVTWFD